ncbi:MAG: Hsp70 family protein [Acidimicrobiales bacterium]
MSYHLGIDLGTTYTAAAAHEGGRVEVVPLGDRGPSIPSVLYLKPDGSVVAGDAANRHAITDPERVAREFKRRLGDPTPVQLGGVATPPELLTGQLLRSVYDTVVRAKGTAPASVVLTHPANWGPYKRDLLVRAAEGAGLAHVTLVTEPQAAAISYASQARVDAGAVVAVYDLGGGTFDAAVLRKEADGTFSVLGSPEGIERLGGIDFDAAVFNHVTQSLEGVFDELDPEDEATIAAVARLRQECTQAKEALSVDTEATIPVLLPTTQTEVRATRAELENMIRPPLGETISALNRALRSAGLTPADVSHVLLVGGSSRIPLIAGLVSAELGRPVAVDAHPKHAVALGAAIVAARVAGVPVGDAAQGRPAPAVAPNLVPAAVGTVAAAGSVAAAAAVRPTRPPAPSAPPPPAPPAYAAATPPPPSSPGPPPGSPGAPPPPPAPPTRGPAPSAPPAGYTSSPAAAPSPPDYQRPNPPTMGTSPQAPPPPPAPSGRPGWDPTFDAAATEAPGPSLGYRAAGLPPPPGTSTDLPPGYTTQEQRKRTQRKQRRRSRLGMLVGGLILVVCVAATLALTARQNEPDSLADVEEGECFLGDDLSDLEIVGCGEAHRGELVAILAPADANAAFPGEEALHTEHDEACALRVEEYFGGARADLQALELNLFPLVPTEAQWNDEMRDTFCYVGPNDQGETVSGTIESEGAAAAAATTTVPPG